MVARKIIGCFVQDASSRLACSISKHSSFDNNQLLYGSPKRALLRPTQTKQADSEIESSLGRIDVALQPHS
jgi:hypothetical protein